MAKKTKKKYYAIKEGRGVKNIIVNTWDECEKIVSGYNSTYKSFSTKEEAKVYLKPVKKEIKKIQVSKQEPKDKKLTKPRKSKKNTITLEIDLSKELYNKFLQRCTELEAKPKKILDALMLESLEEWVED